jgi:phosphoesterase RecJ-like protein
MLKSRIMEDILSEIRSTDRIVLATHISPDPDAIGSAGALCLALREIGKDAVLYLPEKLSGKLAKLFPVEFTTPKVPSDPYLLIGLDCATKKRLGKDNERLCINASKIINIDHHVSNERWGSLNHIVGNEAATAILVHELIEELGIEYSENIANLLYAGIMDDTGSFRYSNTSANALTTCADLIKCGARPEFVADILYFQEPLRVMKLRGKALETLSLIENESVAIVYVDLEMLISTGAEPDDTEGVIDIARAIEGVEIALFIRQMDSDTWKGSIRAKNLKYDVGEFAAQFGGGGHKAAAGFTIKGSRVDVMNRLIFSVQELVQNGCSNTTS